MRRTLVVLSVVGAACSTRPVQLAGSPSRTEASGRKGAVTATTLLSDAAQAFDRNDLVGPIQSGSIALVRTVRGAPGLEVKALHSPSNEAAVEVRETDEGSQRWGRLMIPAERTIIAAFARHPDLGRWLVIVDDVRVSGGPDPIPLTGYRWPRADVESYARCGIPRRAIDGCTSRFYTRSQMWLMPVGSKPIGG